MVIVMHQGFLSLLILSRALISNARLQSHAVLHLSWVVAGLGWAGLAARPAGTAPRLRGIRQAAVQLEPLGWESLKQQTSQNKGMFHCFFWLSGFLFSKELLQHLWGRGLACAEPCPRADPCLGGKFCCLTSGRGRGCKRSAATFARDLQQECWRLGFFSFFFFLSGNFVPSVT